MSVVSIRVSKISSGQLRVGVSIAQSRRRHLASIWLTVFKWVRNGPSATTPTWAFGVRVYCVTQDHPAHIP